MLEAWQSLVTSLSPDQLALAVVVMISVLAIATLLSVLILIFVAVHEARLSAARYVAVETNELVLTQLQDMRLLCMSSNQVVNATQNALDELSGGTNA